MHKTDGYYVSFISLTGLHRFWTETSRGLSHKFSQRCVLRLSLKI